MRLVWHEHSGCVSLRRRGEDALVERQDVGYRPTTQESVLKHIDHIAQLPELVSRSRRRVVGEVKIPQDRVASIAGHEPTKYTCSQGSIVSHRPVLCKSSCWSQHVRHKKTHHAEDFAWRVVRLGAKASSDLAQCAQWSCSNRRRQQLPGSIAARVLVNRLLPVPVRFVRDTDPQTLGQEVEHELDRRVLHRTKRGRWSHYIPNKPWVRRAVR